MKRKGFTLAEVLITLTIIGVIAIITIPNLMKKWEDTYIISAVKASYSMLDNAIKKMYAEEGLPEDWLDHPASSDNNMAGRWYTPTFVSHLSKYLKMQDICTTNATAYLPKNYSGAIIPECGKNKSWRDRGFRSITHLNGNGKDSQSNYGNVTFAVLENGMWLKFDIWLPVSSDIAAPIGAIWVDINGGKKPNRYGYDVFQFPLGRTRDTAIKMHYRIPYRDYTEVRNFYSPNYCNGPTSNGWTCSIYIIRFNNVDYKYKDVSDIFK